LFQILSYLSILFNNIKLVLNLVLQLDSTIIALVDKINYSTIEKVNIVIKLNLKQIAIIN